MLSFGLCLCYGRLWFGGLTMLGAVCFVGTLLIVLFISFTFAWFAVCFEFVWVDWLCRLTWFVAFVCGFWWLAMELMWFVVRVAVC